MSEIRAEVETGREFLKNSSREGEEKLQNFIHDQFDRLSPREFTEMIYKMQSSPENKTNSGPHKDTLGIYAEDANGNGFLEIPEIFTVNNNGGMSSYKQLEPQKSSNASGSEGSLLERAYKRVKDTGKAIENPLKGIW